jgi:DNA repair ATPase RecN
MLREIQLKNVGPSEELSFEFNERYNLLTGDNGVGKSFILDVAWWAASGSWTAPPNNE